MPRRLARGLLLHYSFPAPAATVTDESGNGNNGTPQGSEWVANGYLGGAYAVGRGRGYVSHDGFARICPKTELTVAAWIKADTFGRADYLAPVVSHHGAGSGWELRTGQGRPGMVVTVDHRHYTAVSKQTLKAGRWHHLAGVYDGRNVTLYVDAKCEASIALSGSITLYGGALNIGRNPSWRDRTFEGLIDEVMVFDRALSASEIRSLVRGMEKAGRQ